MTALHTYSYIVLMNSCLLSNNSINFILLFGLDSGCVTV